MKEREMILSAFGFDELQCTRTESFTHFFKDGSQISWVVEIFEDHVLTTMSKVPSSSLCPVAPEEYQAWKQEVLRTVLPLLPFPYQGSMSIGDDVWRLTVSPKLLRLHEFPSF
jgi:hypothetical protein